MNWSIVKEVLVKDLQELSKNRYVFYSMLFLPAVLVLITGFDAFTSIGRPGIRGSDVILVISVTAQSFVLVPAIVSVLIGSTSVVIEKNNRSLEPLLATPITDSELLVGKSLAPFIPALLLGLAAYAAVIGLVDAITYPAFGYFLLPSRLMLYQMFALTPLVALFGTFVALFVSSKMKDVRAAQQISMFAVLPLFLVLIAGAVALSSSYLLIIGITMALIAGILAFAWLAIKTFNRESILVTWK